MHRIELDSVKKYRPRSTQEYRMVNRARWGDLESVGDGQNIVKLAGMMLAKGVTGPVEVYRGKTPVFHSGTVEQWATGRFGRGEQPEQLRRAKG